MKYLSLVILGSFLPPCCYTSVTPVELCAKLSRELKKNMENNGYPFEVSFPCSDCHRGSVLDSTPEGVAWECEKEEGLL